ncbi:DUF742 domain-containing protein [Streptomyces sp. Go40/10]|uniref:DUF742 domain-containing protein n=1 Tax=Streptomyces sp. Go40/10 TaxID=2825844 RepID=UPI001E4AF4CA|nr:DUF742 domain-containing protein [Streptomyces sp. Go40/10]UFQ99782.1 DUF742 domain-containing protein [Streptomyces sp. Go40/10]
MTENEAAASEAGLGPPRPYALVRGRAKPSKDLERTTLVVLSANSPSAPLQPHYEQIARMCTPSPCSIAEIAGRLRQPLQVVKVMVSDMIVDHYLVVPQFQEMADGSDMNLLKDVLDGLRNLI